MARYDDFLTAIQNGVVAVNNLTTQATTVFGRLRPRLTAATTFYVSTTGNDSNTGLSTATPWQTFAHAMSVLTTQIDFGGQNVTLQVTGTSGNFTTSLVITPWNGGGSLTADLGGKTINYAGVFSTDGAVNVTGGALPGIFTIQNGTLSCSKGASTLFCASLLVASASTVALGINLIFGNADVSQIMSNNGGCVIKLATTPTVPGNITVSASAAGAFIFGNTGVIANFNQPVGVTFTTAVSYSNCTVTADTASLVVVGHGMQWINSTLVTGKRCNADTAGVLNTQGQIDRVNLNNYIPGTVNGTVTPPGAVL